jgi:hypothetical protein
VVPVDDTRRRALLTGTRKGRQPTALAAPRCGGQIRPVSILFRLEVGLSHEFFSVSGHPHEVGETDMGILKHENGGHTMATVPNVF